MIAALWLCCEPRQGVFERWLGRRCWQHGCTRETVAAHGGSAGAWLLTLARTKPATIGFLSWTRRWARAADAAQMWIGVGRSSNCSAAVI